MNKDSIALIAVFIAIFATPFNPGALVIPNRLHASIGFVSVISNRRNVFVMLQEQRENLILSKNCVSALAGILGRSSASCTVYPMDLSVPL